ncbi:MAG: TIM44-like domain-containing protein [Deltaproteobacteria bacterium]|nr:TIM44-like domain-containing protein [Deltaproteobacteria bacterium]
MRARAIAYVERNGGRVATWVGSSPARLLVLLAAGVVVLDTALAAARPGGGQNYSGGSGDSGGGGGGGFAVVIHLAVYLLRLCIDYPAVGLPIVGVLIVGYTVYHYTNPNHRTRAAVQDLEESVMATAQRDLGVLRDRDPNMNEQAFLQDAGKTVLAVQQAWCAGDMRPVRRLLSDGVYNRFTALLAMNAARGFRNGMAESTIEAPVVAAVERDSFFDTVHVRVAGKARDADVPLTATPEQAQKLLRKARLEKYFEVWSFLRRPGAQTKAGQTVIEGRCPNCGADQPVGDVVECPFCHALVNSGEFGWVLAEITQASEWRAGSVGSQVDGLDEYWAVDPNFNRQQVEDRASFLFWKWVEARVTRQPAAVRKLSSRRLSDYVASEAASGGIGGGQTTMERVAVGAADLVGVEAGESGGQDRAYVRIRWSAAYARKAQPVPATNVLVLVREAGVATKVGLSGDRCKNCGAPVVTATDSPQCDFCGAELGAGKQDWVLDEVAAPTAVVMRRRRVSRVAPAPQAGAFAPVMMAPLYMPAMPMQPGMGMQPAMPMQPGMGMAPAMPVQPGMPVQAAVPMQAGMPAPLAAPAAPVVAAAPPPGDEDEAGPAEPEAVPPWALPDMSSPQERSALLARMAVIAAADGVVTRQERRLLKKCSKRWGVPFSSIEPILKSGVASVQAMQSSENPQRFMMGLVAAALIDGKVDRKERLLLEGVAHNMGLPADVVPGLITAMVEWKNAQAGRAA